LGPDITKYIIYPGGNAFYISDVIESRLGALKVCYHGNELEDLFWPFLRPDIKRAVAHFRGRSRSRRAQSKLSVEEQETLQRTVHAFDKRRAHYLRFGDPDQGSLTRMPPALIKHLAGKSRDEIEQQFMTQEQALKATELKTYVYTAFDLQRFFPTMMAKKMPQILDQHRVDQYFLEEICHINRILFNSDAQQSSNDLNAYLIRYVTMFFDHDYQNSDLLDDYAKEFMYRHHFYKQTPQKKPVQMEKACQVFGVKQEVMTSITRSRLNRLYRRLALKHHPDKGGSNEKFVELTETYEGLLERLFKI